ncbi:MAG TPA: hypothetical protein VHN14_07870 [Kofleriaceae bacterium]|jgi:hypothetical protein|nr:hypothetical protein [Kofleriaceae bacterium]
MRLSLCSFALVLGFGISLGQSLGGCGGDKTSPPAASGSGSAATAPAAATVEIFVNDASVATVQAAQLASWPRLDSLVPADVRKLGTWEVVSLQGAKPTPTDVARPSSSYPDMVPAIFPAEGGGVSFGMFDPVELAKKGKPALREDHVKAIRIKVAQGGNRGQNDDGGGAAADPTKLVVSVKTPAGTTMLTGDKLLALPREPMPGNPDQKGWRLAALLEAAGVKTYEHLVLSDASGTSLTLDRKDLDDNTVPFIKLNKSGSLRFRVLKKAGDGWNPSGDLRGLMAIEAK